MAASVQNVTLRGASLDVLCDPLPVFEHVEQLVLSKDPQEVGLAMLAATTMAASTV